MDTICKHNKYGHCRYGSFCKFIHENKKCETESCDHRTCPLRHPKPCRYIKAGKICRFETFCDFDHGVNVIEEDIEALKLKVESLEKLVKLKDIEIGSKDEEIETKTREICELKMSVKNSRIVQLDGHGLDLASTDTENDENTEESFVRQEMYSCESCEFETFNGNGLKIHSSRKHKHKCDDCGKVFSSRENLDRHKKAKMILKNSNPLNSPDATKKLRLNDFGEPFIEVVSTDSLCPVALLSFETHQVLKYHDVPLFDIEIVVLGDLSEEGCFVDWAAVSMVLGKHEQER